MAVPGTRPKDGQAYGDVRAPLSLDKLQPFLEKNVDGFAGPITVKQFGFGQSNPTYLLQTPAKSYVLRRAPLGPLLSKTAHRVDREFLVLEALNKFNARLPKDTPPERFVPVPQVYALCMDPEVAGSPFYIMEFLKGRIFTDVQIPDLPEEERFACWRSAVQSLALLGSIPVSALGLPASFAPDPIKKPYFPRQVVGMHRVSDAQSQAPVPGNPGGILGPVWGADELWPYYEQGSKAVSAAEVQHGASLVHGDYKLDNLVFHPTEPRVIGILDWELCTLGSPLADLGNMLIPFSFPPVSDADKAELTKNNKTSGTSNLVLGLKGLSSAQTGVPTSDVLEQWWVAGMNEGYLWHAPIPAPRQWPNRRFEWVRSWMLFRLAVIAQGIAARAALGQASSASASVDRAPFDFFGKMAYQARGEPEVTAKL
ncbi:hypothetical protein VHUM_01219 [Vanrija humicola]|uniref:Aminoglycoside phosphotransferase domain-containing protein n=1 Tax=Vanrija humicola TaxID=5417 RepID=A0A7D8V3C8_VANHU|nr:hypothetical protein VHUM_01219 [Vanrija humicola]